jgi:DNA-binding NarL/FixJ family response regulator
LGGGVNAERTRIFLVEDEPLTRAGSRLVLSECYDVVGEADNVTDSVAMIRELEPDLVLLDIRIKEGSGATVVEQVRRTHPETRFLALTVSTSRHDVAKLFDIGVDGYLTKDLEGDLCDLVAEVLSGGRPISRHVAGYLLDIDESVTSASDIDRLTPREREVVALIARGYTYKETAVDLGISVKTLENHMHNIFTKLGVASRHELTRQMYEDGFVNPALIDEPPSINGSA